MLIGELAEVDDVACVDAADDGCICIGLLGGERIFQGEDLGGVSDVTGPSVCILREAILLAASSTSPSRVAPSPPLVGRLLSRTVGGAFAEDKDGSLILDAIPAADRWCDVMAGAVPDGFCLCSSCGWCLASASAEAFFCFCDCDCDCKCDGGMAMLVYAGVLRGGAGGLEGATAVGQPRGRLQCDKRGRGGGGLALMSQVAEAMDSSSSVLVVHLPVCLCLYRSWSSSSPVRLDGMCIGPFHAACVHEQNSRAQAVTHARAGELEGVG